MGLGDFLLRKRMLLGRAIQEKTLPPEMEILPVVLRVDPRVELAGATEAFTPEVVPSMTSLDPLVRKVENVILSELWTVHTAGVESFLVVIGIDEVGASFTLRA